MLELNYTAKGHYINLSYVMFPRRRTVREKDKFTYKRDSFYDKSLYVKYI